MDFYRTIEGIRKKKVIHIGFICSFARVSVLPMEVSYFTLLCKLGVQYESRASVKAIIKGSQDNN